jgi:hypothetical protein
MARPNSFVVIIVSCRRIESHAALVQRLGAFSAPVEVATPVLLVAAIRAPPAEAVMEVRRRTDDRRGAYAVGLGRTARLAQALRKAH